MNVLSYNFNRFITRLIISLMLSVPSYAVFALIRNLDFNRIQTYAFAEYGTAVFIGLFLMFETHNLKSIFLEKKLPWSQYFYLRLSIEILITFVLTAIFTTGAYAGLYTFVWKMKVFFPSVVLYNTIGIFISHLFMVFVNAQYIIDNWKKAMVKAESLEKENVKAKLAALQNQISPHFLFNNFNILNALIDENIDVAKKYLSKLSDVFRYILKHKHSEVVSLDEELQFVKDFTFLIKTRFGNNFQINIDVSNEVENKQVPPVSIQMLVENAIKHNEISERNTLLVNILENEKGIVVTNFIKRKKNKNTAGTKTGLLNIKERYHFLTDEEVIIDEDDKNFSVTLPLLKIHRKETA